MRNHGNEIVHSPLFCRIFCSIVERVEGITRLDASVKQKAEQSTSAEFEQLLELHTVLFCVCVVVVVFCFCRCRNTSAQISSYFPWESRRHASRHAWFILVSGCLSKRHDYEAMSAILKVKKLGYY